MEKETKKIAWACFIGGVLCCAVALMFTPSYWWLGLIAGAAGGYISYEFREVRKAVPIAMRLVGSACQGWWKGLVDSWISIKEMLITPRPFFCLGVILSSPLIAIVHPQMWHAIVHKPEHLSWQENAVGLVIVYFLTIFIIRNAFCILASIGAEAKKQAFYMPFWSLERSFWLRRIFRKGFEEVSVTYANAVRWIGRGIFEIAWLFVWRIWKWLAIGLWHVVISVPQFLWFMFKLIHSEERVLCALDGTLGGVLSYFWLAPTATTPAGQVLLCLFGGLLGAAFGIVDWELVSKRWLHVDAKDMFE